MKPKITFIILLTALLSFSCNDNDKNLSLSSEKDLLSFSFSKELNSGAHIRQGIEARVSTDEIIVFIPENVDKTHLIASFEFKGSSIWVHSSKQNSSVLDNGFTQPIHHISRARA